MKTSQILELLRKISPKLQVKLQHEEYGVLPVGKVYHESARTFLQEAKEDGAKEDGAYSTVKGLLEHLESIDATVPFDADLVSGDDWNFQVVQGVFESDGIVLIQISDSVFD
ncbi:hypothetical protein BOO92_13975 [Vibrio navarrensis]|uniref:hypothetical protein n=1 Tax=Vibrio navarrensis TaxID=29495 RepID=UPI00186691AF|nr:hypothetical protein [Vibrio navarrensis]MBE3657785.1 hypothetical protein [Vibrio navarrensis]